MKKERNKIEIWLNRYNDIMELIRTLAAITVLILQVIILYHIFSQ